MKKKREPRQKKDKGRLRIGDDWNAITIIALSQNNPLKAIAEFVENSIDAKAKNVTIIRGKERGSQYLKIVDDGEGIPCTNEGIPDFKYVATHICDSLKKRLKEEGITNVQGEFGIGLLSFWTVGHKLDMISSGRNGMTYQMEMEKGRPGYTIKHRYRLIPITGAQLTISPLLAGVRSLNGEKIQRYLASELRDRIRNSGVKVKIIDRTSRFEFEVEPRKYSGQLLHNFPKLNTSLGDIYVELYLDERSADNVISLFRSGTRVLPSITILDEFQNEPWVSGYFQGIIDVPFLQLTPGARDGIIRDDRFAILCEVLKPFSEYLKVIAREQKEAEEERMSRNVLRSVQKALREAISILPREDYDWFDIYEKSKYSVISKKDHSNASTSEDNGLTQQDSLKIVDEYTIQQDGKNQQKRFFEFAGPLFSVKIQPGSALVAVDKDKTFRAIGMDRHKRQVEDNLSFSWDILEGEGRIDNKDGEIITFHAPFEPGLTKIKVAVRQKENACESECIITIVDVIIKQTAMNNELSRGLPGYTLENCPGQLWRSKYDNKRNVIIINSGHRDFIYANKQKARKLRYICRLFAKELIYHNVVGVPIEQLLERMVELSLYTEDNLK